MTKIVLKIYYYANDIRRVTKDIDEINSHDALMGVVGDVLGMEDVSRVGIKYEDEDGDYITLGHDGDVAECLSHVSEGDVLKIRLSRRFGGFGRFGAHGRPVIRRVVPQGFKRFSPGLSLHRRGMALLQQQKYDDAMAVFVEEAMQGGRNEIAYYNAACAASLAGYPIRAVAFLRNAVGQGYTNVTHMKNDADLDNIRNEQEYKEIVEKLEKPQRDAKYFELQKKGFALLEKSDFHSTNAAMLVFREQLKLRPNDIYATYNMACCYSLIGDVEAAITKLNEAISFGYTNFNHMATDPDLRNARLMANFPQQAKQDEAKSSKEEESSESEESYSEDEESDETYEDESSEESYSEEESEEEDSIEEDETVSALAAMGFSVDRVQLALQEASQDTNRAVELLLGC